ncbi:Hypothetical predicted protein [Lecanosticta acicola]|uniref:Uncharacterized protein n=1 Tax=Lecanosticta acicola TaxID=111012 RepID=A0AAI8Z238_9PEZI|nr:Hypothetical predicted protein [Lecanosticta acicola]
MSKLFSRRRGSSASRHAHHLPLDPTTSSNAAAAATQAFLRRPPSSGSLSSAAAAAALRSHTTSPEPVGSIQTKRMVRRGSISSVGSGSVVRGRPGVQRRGSSSSMTDRTFRSPSPASQPHAARPVPQARDAPPVPAIPSSLSTEQKRSSSVQPPPKRVTSPTPPGRGTRRAMSMDRTGAPPPATSRKALRLSNVNEETETPDSNRNVNFSRPRTSQPSSPTSPTAFPTTDRQYTHGTGAWFSEPPTAPSGRQPTTSREAALQQKIARIQAAAGQPVKKSHEATSAQGTYLGKANQQPPRAPSAEPAPTSYETSDSIMVYDPNSRTFVAKPRTKPKAPAPVPPLLPQSKPLAPGTYDPSTRTIVPAPAPAPGQRPAVPTLETDPVPPPRNPARLSPVDTPSATFLKKQPSVVREEPELESSGPVPSSVRNVTTTTAPAKSYVTPAVSKQRSSSLDIPRGALERAYRGRGGSTSPSPARSAHFSHSPVIQATRHDPPPRDISPAKSALKHSPASSIRTHSPLAHFSGPRSPITETSDTASQASEDVFTGRKKKSVRVSFDEQPHEIEVAAAPPPKTLARERSPTLDDRGDEDMMGPRPVLPSFGSIRKQRVAPDVAEKVTEMAPERHDASNDHAIGGILREATEAKSSGEPVPPEVTSKETAGYVSDESDDLGAPAAVSTPAQPAAVSSTESSPEETKTKDFAQVPQGRQNEDGDVPAINLLPPTPAAEDEPRTLAPGQSHKQRDSADIEMPGSWDKKGANQAEVTSAGAATASALAVDATHQAPAVPQDPVISQSPEHSPTLAAIDEDTDMDEFSDAAEDLSELDNGGFASLDAIAVSPVIHSTATDQSTVGTASPPESPSAKQTSKKANGQADGQAKGHASTGSSDWSEATAYWSKLSKQQREQIEREHFSSDDEARPSPAVKKTKKKTAPKQTETSAPAAAVATPAAARPAAAKPAAPAMKKSMRAQPEPTPAESEVHMRRSMRNGGTGGGMAATLRSGPPASKQQPATATQGPMQNRSMRPASTGLPSSAASAATHARQSSDTARSESSAYSKIQPKPRPQPKMQAAPVVTAKVQKELANDSDSESSFKKKRRTPKVDSSGRYTMSRSMRGGPVGSEASARQRRQVSPTPSRQRGADSFSIRSLSPSGSLFGRKKRVDDVRQSIRGSSVDAGPRTTMRNRPSSSKTSARPVSSRQTSKFKSRFNDSDDEGEDDAPRRGAFRSRFADSDDEDDDVFIPADLTPVRGIPRRQGQNDGDSTDLEDEDDAEDVRKSTRMRNTPLVPDPADIDKAMEAARKKLGMTNGPPPPAPNNTQGSSLQQGSLRDSQLEPKSRPEDVVDFAGKRRRGFMGGILRRNRNSTASVATISSTSIQQRQSTEVPQMPAVATTSFAAATASPSSPSAARPPSLTSPSAGKLIRRSSAQQAPRMRRGDSTYSNATAPPDVRDVEARYSDWPLPAVPSIPDKYKDRPNTSDGASTQRRHSADKVRFQDVNGEKDAMGGKNNVYSQRTGKKKRFGRLRRAFGLDD